MNIKIYDDYNLFKKHTFEFNEGLTCLIGKNYLASYTSLRNKE